jgi:hypothetical protein
MGWDSREVEAYQVAKFSIIRRTSVPVKIEPLMLKALEHEKLLTRRVENRDGKLWCPISDAAMATEFAISRFCVPFLQRDGWALFMDPDMLVQADIAEVFKLADPKYAVMVVKHDHQPKDDIKMDGQRQTVYARKNWSSFVLWNCEHSAHKGFTRKMLNTLPGIALHQFRWLDDSEIGELPTEWNWLAGVNDDRPASELKNIHYTLGGPWFANCKSPYDAEWLNERAILDTDRCAA